MEISYELTQRDIYEAIIAHRNRSVFSRWMFRIATFASIVCLLLCLGAALFISPAFIFPSYLPLAFFCAVWLFVAWGSPRLAARTQYKKQPAMQGPRIMTLDPAGIHWRWDSGSADIEWKNFIRALDSKNHVLFYSSPMSFNIVPKRALNEDQTVEFNALLKSYLLKK
jgi:hypothetical protein